MRILLIEDSPDDALSLREMLAEVEGAALDWTRRRPSRSRRSRDQAVRHIDQCMAVLDRRE